MVTLFCSAYIYRSRFDSFGNQTDVRFAEWIYMKQYKRLDLLKLYKILTLQIHCSNVLNDQCITSKQNYEVHSVTRLAIFGNTSAFLSKCDFGSNNLLINAFIALIMSATYL